MIVVNIDAQDVTSFVIAKPVGTIEDMSEPFLMQPGLLAKTPKGRVLTEKGIEYLTSTQGQAREVV